MKKKYIQPNVSVRFVVVESLLQTGSKSGADPYQNDYYGTCAKEHNFSSFDYDFDEEEDTESNSSSKPLWD